MNSVVGSLIGGSGHRYLPFGRVVDRSRQDNRPELDSLSVFLGQGVVLRSSRDDNHNRLGADLTKYLVVRPGDLVFNKLRTWQGGFGRSRYEGIVSPAYFVCRPRPEVDTRFLHYVLLSSPYLAELTRLSKFMPPSQFDIMWDDLKRLPVPIPNLKLQRAIADYLDVETARIDALIEKKRRTVELLEERREADVFHAITRGVAGTRPLVPSGLRWLEEIPEGWGTPTVSMNFDLQLGKMLNDEAAGGTEQYPYLRNVNVQWDRIDLDDLATMNFSASDRKRCELRSGDLLVCEGGEVGRAAIWTGQLQNCYFQKAIHRVRPRGHANTRFLMYCLRAAASRSVFAVEGNQSTIVHLTGEQLRAHRFPWPPDDEQAAIVAHLDQLAATMKALSGSLDGQIDLLIEHRQALITAAVTGDLPIPGVAA